MAAEQKARVTYENILRLIDDPDIIDPIRFLRQREINHFQRFGEALRMTQDSLDPKNFYQYNPDLIAANDQVKRINMTFSMERSPIVSDGAVDLLLILCQNKCVDRHISVYACGE